MDRLPHEPVTLRDLAEADLRRGARLIIRIQDELDPQVRMATPEGDYHIAMTLPADDYGRKLALRALGTFMVWRQVVGFTWVSEWITPDCICAIAVDGAGGSHAKVSCLSRISRSPMPWTKANFSAVEWLPEASIMDEMIDLLPRGPRVLTPKEIAACNTWFGVEGKFPAVHLPTGEVRGV